MPEPVRIPEARQLSPGDHERLLHGVLGPVEVPQDPLGDGEEPVSMGPRDDPEGLAVPTLS